MNSVTKEQPNFMKSKTYQTAQHSRQNSLANSKTAENESVKPARKKKQSKQQIKDRDFLLKVLESELDKQQLFQTEPEIVTVPKSFKDSAI